MHLHGTWVDKKERKIEESLLTMMKEERMLYNMRCTCMLPLQVELVCVVVLEAAGEGTRLAPCLALSQWTPHGHGYHALIMALVDEERPA